MKKFIKANFLFLVKHTRPFRIWTNNVVTGLRLKYYLSIRDQLHNKRLKIIRKKLSKNIIINVAFIVFDSAIWKYDQLYRLLESDRRFLPTIVIAIRYGKNRDESFRTNLDFFEEDYNVLGGRDSTLKYHLKFKKNFNPDIVVTSSPYDYFNKQFRSYSLVNYLTIYCQYGITNSNLVFPQVNLHNNLLWKFYIESHFHLKLFTKWMKENDKSDYNFKVSGYIGAQNIKFNTRASTNSDRSELKLVIWAPHWSIDKSNDSINISTFLDYYEEILEITEKYKGKIDFALKPHPLLREMLSREDFWGLDSTNDYFDRWEKGINTSLVHGNYIDLFNQSDSILHDSGTFTVEYLYTAKPAAYLINDRFDLEFYNDYGKEALKCYQFIKNKKDIVNFLDNLISGKDPKLKKRQEFYNQYLRDHHHTASENVYNDILNSILDVK